jgi:hypothetical protein
MISLPLKAVLGGGAYLAFKPLILSLLTKIGSKISVKLAGKLGAKIAAKTGGLLAGNVGSVLLDSTIGVGIIIWDIWDTYHTGNIEKPLLRQNLVDYLYEVKESLLLNPENGIMTIIDAMEKNILQSLNLAKNLINK